MDRQEEMQCTLVMPLTIKGQDCRLQSLNAHAYFVNYFISFTAFISLTFSAFLISPYCVISIACYIHNSKQLDMI